MGNHICNYFFWESRKSLGICKFSVGASQITFSGTLLKEIMGDKAESEFGSQFIELWSEFRSPTLFRNNLITCCTSITANRSILTKIGGAKNS